MEDKVEKFFEILYPKYNEFTQETKDRVLFDKKILEENIEIIDEYYKKYIITENDSEIEEDIEVKNVDVEVEIEVENEDIDSAEVNDKDQEIINIVEEKEVDNSKEKEILLEILKDVKVNIYFNLLYPEFENLSEEEQVDLLVDKSFIEESIEAIDEYYQDCKAPGTGAEIMGLTDKQIIQTGLRLFRKQEQGFTKEDIEQLTGSLRIENLKQATASIRGTEEEQDILIPTDSTQLDE